MILLMTTSAAFAGTNTVSGDLESYYVNPPVVDVSVIAAADPVAGVWAVPYASASARANYGTNHISFAWSPPVNFEIDPFAPFVGVESKWTDTLVITGGSGTNVAVFRLLIQGDINGNGAFFGGWDFNIGPDLFYTGEGFPEGNFSYFRYLNYPFTYGVPFTVYGRVGMGVGVSNVGQRSGSGELRLADILLPAGAAISATSGDNWLTNIKIIYPSLDITSAGTDVRLHWIQPPNYYLESTTNLLSGDGWSKVDDLLFQQINDTEFSSTFPLPTDSPARFFRLQKDPNR
jgi:hypothetical protein